MKKQKIIMGMPVTIEIAEKSAKEEDISEVFSFLHSIDNKFSPYKKDSEVFLININKISSKDYSKDMKSIIALSEKTKRETNGFFDVYLNGVFDPSGIVKGFAIYEASKILQKKGYKNFYVEIAGDIQVAGKNKKRKWKVGIENPFNRKEIIKVIGLSDRGIATSGTYIRGKHIYNPKNNSKAEEISSISVIGPNVYDADRFATAAFAMGEKGMDFISSLKGFEGYMIKKDKTAVFTKGFEGYVFD